MQQLIQRIQLFSRAWACVATERSRTGRALAWAVYAVASLAAVAATAAPGFFNHAFGDNGVARSALSATLAGAQAVSIQPDGKIVLAGTCGPYGARVMCVTRMTRGGLVDLSFGSGGQVTLTNGTFYNDYDVVGVVTQASGRIVVGATCISVAISAPCIFGLLPSGSTDTTFGVGVTGQNASVDVTLISQATAMAFDASVGIFLSGVCSTVEHPEEGRRFCTTPFSSDGSLFTNANQQKLGIPTGDYVGSALAIQSDGKIVVAGICRENGDSQFCALRYEMSAVAGELVLDTTFNGTGKLIIAQQGRTQFTRTVTVQRDGKIIIVGNCSTPTSASQFCALRLNADATIDMTFNGTGRVEVSYPGFSAIPAAVALQPDGKIIVTGSCGTNFCWTRLTESGVLDESFGTGGRSIATLGINANANAVAIQPDGRIVSAGYCEGAAGRFDMCAMRIDGGQKRECNFDVDGDGTVRSMTDLLILSRVSRGMRGSSVTASITFPPAATRTSWSAIRDYLAIQCGIALPQ
jgi:uncharacterized delta-60 repeat protein